MGQYSLCYTSGRQFVFAERSHSGNVSLASLVTLCAVAAVVGVILTLSVSFVGFFQVEVGCFVMGTLAARRAYVLVFKRTSTFVDVYGFLMQVLLCGMFLGLLLAALRYSVTLDMGCALQCTLFSGVLVLLAPIIYGYLILCCTEDERKHVLGPCNADGHFVVMRSFSGMGSGGGRKASTNNSWDALQQFARNLLSWSWWCDMFDRRQSSAQIEDADGSDSVTVYNRSLKLIKVCFYSDDDMFCWVPFGGISGSCVAFIHAESFQTFKLPLSNKTCGKDEDEMYQLKVFQPALFDKELCCYRHVRRGQSFNFLDVEGLVRRSKALSLSESVGCASTASSSGRRLSALSSDESSGSEAGMSPMSKQATTTEQRTEVESCYQLEAHMDRVAVEHDTAEPPSPSSGSSSPPFTHQLDPPCTAVVPSTATGGGGLGCSLRRVTSGGNLAHSQWPSPRERSQSRRSSTSSQARRKAGPEEVVILNRSSQDVRAVLFHANDYVQLVPLIGRLASCGDIILEDSERRFTPPNQSEQEFTLKVYSVGPASKELTYLTVSRGQTYMFHDSLLS